MRDMNIDNAIMFLDFVRERHRVWECRQAGLPQPWTDDPILASRKFTNVFRVLDPGTQFFIKELMSAEPRDVLARAIFYRLTNRPETWTALRHELGHYPLADDLNESTADRLCFLRDEGMQVFSGAYMIAGSLGAKAGMDKSREAVLTSERVLRDAWPAFDKATSNAERFKALRAQSGMGDFMSAQILADIGYAGLWPDEENDFVTPGPGAIKGAALIDSEWKAERVIRWAQPQLTDVTITLSDGRARAPSLLDVQNCFCEYFKFHRYFGKPLSNEPYAPSHPGSQPAPVYPKHW